MIDPEHLPELVRMARQHGYDRAEGFADVFLPTTDLQGELAAKLAELAEELAGAAGVSPEIASSAVVNSALTEHADRANHK
jgi:hypothetical protein